MLLKERRREREKVNTYDLKVTVKYVKKRRRKLSIYVVIEKDNLLELKESNNKVKINLPVRYLIR